MLNPLVTLQWLHADYLFFFYEHYFVLFFFNFHFQQSIFTVQFYGLIKCLLVLYFNKSVSSEFAWQMFVFLFLCHEKEAIMRHRSRSFISGVRGRLYQVCAVRINGLWDISCLKRGLAFPSCFFFFLRSIVLVRDFFFFNHLCQSSRNKVCISK